MKKNEETKSGMFKSYSFHVSCTSGTRWPTAGLRGSFSSQLGQQHLVLPTLLMTKTFPCDHFLTLFYIYSTENSQRKINLLFELDSLIYFCENTLQHISNKFRQKQQKTDFFLIRVNRREAHRQTEQRSSNVWRFSAAVKQWLLFALEHNTAEQCEHETATNCRRQTAAFY